MNYLALAALVLCLMALVSGIAFLIGSSILLAKPDGSQRQDTLFNTFPAELSEPTQGKKRISFWALLSVNAVFSFAAYLISYAPMLVPKYGEGEVTLATIFLLIFVVLFGASMVFAAVNPISKSLKGFLISNVVFIFSVLAVGVFPMMVTTGAAYAFQVNPIVSYVMTGISFLELFQLVNPKIKNWSSMNKTEENGTTYWLKPKVNWLAVAIWSSYAINAILMGCLAVSAGLSLFAA